MVYQIEHENFQYEKIKTKSTKEYGIAEKIEKLYQ